MEPSQRENPQLQIANLKSWVHGRQFPHADDYWDGNWLRVLAEYRSANSRVKAQGPIIHLSELVGLLNSCKELYETLVGEASLDCMEPELKVKLTAGISGQIRLEVSISPDSLSEEHIFRENIDQTYLPSVIAECEAILGAYLVKGSHDQHPNRDA